MSKKRPASDSFRTQLRPVDLSGAYNFPSRAVRKKAWRERAAKMPRGEQRLWGLPFRFAASRRARHVVLLRADSPAVSVPLTGRATHVCIVHYWQGPGAGEYGDAGGEHVADYSLRFRDGREAAFPIRTRFEIGWGGEGWGQGLYNAVGRDMVRVLDFDTPEARRQHGWGFLQTDAAGGGPVEPWVHALVNPRAEAPLAALVLRGVHASPVGVLAVTLYAGPGHPLRHNPRRYFRVDMGSKKAEVTRADVDMGVVVRQPRPLEPRHASWLRNSQRGLGEKAEDRHSPPGGRAFLEATGADGATLSVTAKTGRRERRHDFSLGEALHAGRSARGKARLEVVHPHRTWLHVTVRDQETRKPTPVRIHFSGPNGEYYAPYGHHQVINTNWFEDYGADVKLGEMSYAYVSGEFQTDLPVGEVYVEIVKGFEYAPVRQKLRIAPGQRRLDLEIGRWADLRRHGWVTADTHVHFISPHTAWLQGQGEGLNLINLLASQWGRLFTNVGDITGRAGVEGDGTLVWVGTENRNHMLGHISMLGTKGQPVFPMCCGGPGEAYLGDPDTMCMAEWADRCRERQGVVVRPHFPGPNLENPVDIVLGKFDGVELRTFAFDPDGPLEDGSFREWYRYLNCGYRVAAVGGTDKMSAGMPVGGARTYAKLDRSRPFTFENWAEAVRKGRTFTTSGPLIDLLVDGREIGDVLTLKGGSGTVEMRASARCAWPITRLEIVVNGQVVAAQSAPKGARHLDLRRHVRLPGSCWIAARCGGRLFQQHCWPIHLGAHTSPIYVVVPGTELFSPSDATYMLTMIEGGLTYLENLSIRFDANRHRDVLAIYKKAHAALHHRLQAHHHGGTR